jgi:hypothetical protein
MQRIAIWLLLATLLAAMAWLSIRLAGVRIYAVDECRNISSARILTTGQLTNASANVSPFLAMLWWLTRNSTDAVDFFVRARFLMLEIFWLNLVLIALATGESLKSSRGLIALLGAATLAPLWDYGFEIRADNLLLTCVLLTWCLVRVRPGGVQSYAIAGAIAVVMEFISLKAVVYWLPISLLILAFPPPGHNAPRRKLVIAWLVSALAVLLLIRFIYGLTGTWELYKSSFHRVAEPATGENPFWPWQSLSRLLRQTPLLLALVGAALVALAGDLRRRGKAALTWNSSLPEAFLFGMAFIALLTNPNPYPYNLLHLVPYGFLFAWRYASTLCREMAGFYALGPAVVAVLVFGHLVPFGSATSRHWNWTNFRQENLMRLTEDLTDPVRDPIYDDVGLVPTRPSIDFHSYLQSLDRKEFLAGDDSKVPDLRAKSPAAVLISSYRADRLFEEDHGFIRDHYVSLADDFWVLGKVLPAGGGSFVILRPGRYRISSVAGSDLAGTYPEGLKGMMTPEEKGTIKGQLDGVPILERAAELSIGKHVIETEPGDQPAVVWMGPKVERVHRVPQSDHRTLFVNWY